jgi:hypothetical protein
MMREWPDLERLFARVRPPLQNQTSKINDYLLTLTQNLESSMTKYMRKNTGYNGNSNVQNHNYAHPSVASYTRRDAGYNGNSSVQNHDVQPYMHPPNRQSQSVHSSRFVYASSIATQENV